MVRLWTRALIPVRLRRAARGWFDSRYISRADHRQDIKDALWAVQTLGREVTALRAEVETLQRKVAGTGPDQAQVKRWDDAHRLAQETAVAMDQVLQNEVLLWQAVERLPGGAAPASAPVSASAPAGAGRAVERLPAIVARAGGHLPGSDGSAA
ncbi:hypothetical protein [Streptosporangium sp. NPDC051022]|uniref:hypothetical protein n=1 Tax=Streptosporangium sp. NPDC051022 TaxID=3155752 RepID=UPI00342F0811